MKHVILIEDGGGADAGLSDALRAAGFLASTRGLPDDAGRPSASAPPEPEDAQEHEPAAVLLAVAAGADVPRLTEAVRRASAAWPGAPLVAFRREAASNGNKGSNGHNGSARPNGQPPRLDAAALGRMGFSAVADEPAQLPALLRALESRGLTGELALMPSEPRQPAAAHETQPAPQLPERLSPEALRAAFELVATLHMASDQQGAASSALAGLASLVAADRWTVYLASETGEESILEAIAARGDREEEAAPQPDDWRLALLEAGGAPAEGREARATREAVRRGSPACEAEGGRVVLAVPLVEGDRVAGVVEAVREGSVPFSADDESLLAALAVPVAAALSNAARIAEAERLSQTDDLTKLHNARFLRQYLISEVKRARRYGSPVSAMFMDLDEFKSVNDRYGHLVGSHVLMEMAAVILSSVRDTDVVSRYGGDEFVVILPETGAEQAAGVAERVRERIGQHTFTGGRSLRLRLTASFGVACFPEHAHSPQQLVAAADAAMYEAKAARKNCVRFAPEGGV